MSKSAADEYEKTLSSSIAELKNAKYEDDEGQEERPKNIEMALGLVPMLKEKMDRFPIPTARTAYDGSVEIVWIHGESMVILCVQREAKDQEIDITKFIQDQDIVYRLLPYSPGQEEEMLEVLERYLGDVFEK